MAMTPLAKGLVVEQHPHFIGTYWGAVSTSCCAKIIESTDAYLFAGPIFNDYRFCWVVTSNQEREGINRAA